MLCANSDIPSTVSPNPFVGLYALVTRRNNLGHLVAGDQAISQQEALHAYTAAGAWLAEGLKGTIAPGKLADLVVIDRDYFGVTQAVEEGDRRADDCSGRGDCLRAGPERGLDAGSLYFTIE